MASWHSWPLGFAARRTIIQASSGGSLWVIAIFYGKIMGKPWEMVIYMGKYMFFEVPVELTESALLQRDSEEFSFWNPSNH
jgi:hypothetical protein